MPHVHIDLVQFAVIGANVVIFAFLWRVTAAHLADKSVGQAMAFIL